MRPRGQCNHRPVSRRSIGDHIWCKNCGALRGPDGEWQWTVRYRRLVDRVKSVMPKMYKMDWRREPKSAPAAAVLEVEPGTVADEFALSRERHRRKSMGKMPALTGNVIAEATDVSECERELE